VSPGRGHKFSSPFTSRHLLHKQFKIGINFVHVTNQFWIWAMRLYHRSAFWTRSVQVSSFWIWTGRSVHRSFSSLLNGTVQFKFSSVHFLNGAVQFTFRSVTFERGRSVQIQFNFRSVHRLYGEFSRKLAHKHPQNNEFMFCILVFNPMGWRSRQVRISSHFERGRSVRVQFRSLFERRRSVHFLFSSLFERYRSVHFSFSSIFFGPVQFKFTDLNVLNWTLPTYGLYIISMCLSVWILQKIRTYFNPYPKSTVTNNESAFHRIAS